MVPACIVSNGDHYVTPADSSEGAAIEFSVELLQVSDIIVCGHAECGAMMAVLNNYDPTTGSIKKHPGLPHHLRTWLHNGVHAVQEYHRCNGDPSCNHPSHGNQIPQVKSMIESKHAAKNTHYVFDDIANISFDAGLSAHNKLSQINVITQLRHLMTYPHVANRVLNGGKGASRRPKFTLPKSISSGAEKINPLRLHGWYFDIATGDVFSYDPEKRRFVLLDEAEADRIEKQMNLSDSEAGNDLSKTLELAAGKSAGQCAVPDSRNSIPMFEK